MLLILERNSLSICDTSLQSVAEKNKEARKRRDGSGEECAVPGRSGMCRVKAWPGVRAELAAGGPRGWEFQSRVSVQQPWEQERVNKVLSSFCRKSN